MTEYIECQECGFVLRAEDDSPQPKYWEACPGCESESFAYAGTDTSRRNVDPMPHFH